MARNPKHPGALHLYIHLMEGTGTPEKAERAADTLLTLMPAAGHMVHMPAHIYQRVGRYADAIKSNQLAIAADEDYITPVPRAGPLSHGLLPAQHPLPVVRRDVRRPEQAGHRVGARAGVARSTTRRSRRRRSLAGFRVAPYYALTRFGKWDEMLKEPEPPAFSASLRGRVALRARPGLRRDRAASRGRSRARRS